MAEWVPLITEQSLLEQTILKVCFGAPSWRAPEPCIINSVSSSFAKDQLVFDLI